MSRSDEFEAGKSRPIGHVSPWSAKGEGLFVNPDVNGRAGVDVHSYDHVKRVVKGTTAHRWDADSGTFKKAKVHHWNLHETAGGSHQIPAGGTLADAKPLKH